MADGPLNSYQQYNDLIAKSIASEQAKLNNAPTSPLSSADPLMLAVAQGLLSPTKTGGFGESLGLAAGNIQAPLAAMRKEKLDAQSKIDNLQLTAAKLAMEAPYYAARGDYYENRGLGTGQPSISQQRLETNDDIALYENHDPSELGLTEEQHADKLKALYRKKLRLDKEETTNSGSPGPSKEEPKDDNAGPAGYPDAKQAPNGKFYVPDPKRPGKYLEVQ